MIRVDNGPESIPKSMDLRAYCQKVKLVFSRPGKPTDNAIIESFNGKFREEFLDQYWFLSIEEAIQIVDDWRHDYNHHRPHSSLANKSPIDSLLLQACGQSHKPENVEN